MISAPGFPRTEQTCDKTSAPGAIRQKPLDPVRHQSALSVAVLQRLVRANHQAASSPGVVDQALQVVAQPKQGRL